MLRNSLTGFLLLIAFASCVEEEAARSVVRSGPGFEYLRDEQPRRPLVVHQVRVDRSDPRLGFFPTLGGGRSFGTASVEEQLRAIPAEDGEPLVAISGDYADETDMQGPLGLQIADGEVLRGPASGRAAFYIDASGQPRLEEIETRFAVVWAGERTTPFRLNVVDHDSGVSLLSDAAGRFRDGVDGVGIVLGPSGAEPWLPLRMGQTLNATVVDIASGGGASRPPHDQLLLAIPPELSSTLPPIGPGHTVSIAMRSEPDLSGATAGLGSGPTLVRDGTPLVFDSPVRHPRAAIGWNAEHFFMVAVDGRDVRTSMGMTLSELARYMADLGCEQAMNFDGGASVTLWVLDEVVNHPAGTQRRRPVPNALALVRRP